MARKEKLLYLLVPVAFTILFLRFLSFEDRNLRINAKSPINDFTEFPCLDGTEDLSKFSANITCVRSKMFVKQESPSNVKWCTVLHANRDAPVCTYDPRSDMISYHLHHKGIWEKELVDVMLETVSSTPDMMLFDVGSNLGVYCISAAVSNKTVICLDANYENLRKITSSLQLGELTDKATLIWNAVSNEHQRLSFHIAKDNVGMSRIADFKKNWHTKLEMDMIVDAVTLNDLQNYPGFKDRPIYMKMDVESHEWFVLVGAKDFFKKVDVRVVQVELGEPETKWEVIELFEKYGFLPQRRPLEAVVLDKRNAFIDWPIDVFFVKNMQEFSHKTFTA